MLWVYQGHKVMMSSSHYRRSVGGVLGVQVFPVPPRVKKTKDALAKAMEKGMSLLEKHAKPAKKPGSGVHIAMPVAHGAATGPILGDANSDDDNDGGGSNSDGSANSDQSFVPSNASISGQESEEEQVQAEQAAAKKAKNQNPSFEYEGLGRILVNLVSSSLDVKCSRCLGGLDRTFKARANAKSPLTLAQGRMLGSYFAWLHLDCTGDPRDHVLQYCSASLARSDRKMYRALAMGTGLYQDLFDRERPARGDESDGEPWEVPGSLGGLHGAH